ncbi:hypothetical protein N657DRAFT_55 [Parathielavia appendiculata]|uniref:SWI5-dependent HO expression protein 3 n=1 Tax=Parathielavia appendiculata TaxID=2587402 RepID=A0AAN6U8N1_9PEZI|nr:hypothetical protein N657DRAFT_55 [Parathielavia appendiculata]
MANPESYAASLGYSIVSDLENAMSMSIGSEDSGEGLDHKHDSPTRDSGSGSAPTAANLAADEHGNGRPSGGQQSEEVAELARQNKELRAQLERTMREKDTALEVAKTLVQNASQANANFFSTLRSLRQEANSAKGAWAFLQGELNKKTQQLENANEQLAAARRESEWDRQQLAEMSGDLSAEFEKRQAAEKRVKLFEEELKTTDKELAEKDKQLSDAEEYKMRVELEFQPKYASLCGRFTELKERHEIYLQQLKDATDPTKAAERRAEVMVAVREELNAAISAAERRQSEILEQTREVSQGMQRMVDSLGTRLDEALHGYNDGNSKLEASVEEFLTERVCMKEQLRGFEERMNEMLRAQLAQVTSGVAPSRPPQPGPSPPQFSSSNSPYYYSHFHLRG